MSFKSLDETYEFFSIINSPRGGHASVPQAPPMSVGGSVGAGRPGIQPQSSGKSPVLSGGRDLGGGSMNITNQIGGGYHDKNWKHHPHRDRTRYDWKYYYPKNNWNYYYPNNWYYPYNYYNYYPYYYENETEKCFCQDSNLLGALPDRMVCGQKGCGVCIDRYLCDNCNDNVLCKRAF